MASPTISNNINMSYKTSKVSVSFTVEFGKGIDSDEVVSQYLRTAYDKPYDIENYDVEGKFMYRAMVEEGPFVMKVKNVNVLPIDGIYKKDFDGGYQELSYGLAVVLDMNTMPTYDDPCSFQPTNIVERDGVQWVVMNNKSLKVDQNGNAKYQWSTARALEKGQKPTPEQELMGVEERHENSGMIYITFQPIYKTDTVYHQIEVTRSLTGGATRGLTRGATRGLTRGIGGSDDNGDDDSIVYRGFKRDSVAARVGYGSQAKTTSTSVTTYLVKDSTYILPVRLRIIGDTCSENVKCAKNTERALYVHELQNKTSVFPDMD